MGLGHIRCQIRWIRSPRHANAHALPALQGVGWKVQAAGGLTLGILRIHYGQAPEWCKREIATTTHVRLTAHVHSTGWVQWLAIGQCRYVTQRCVLHSAAAPVICVQRCVPGAPGQARLRARAKGRFCRVAKAPPHSLCRKYARSHMVKPSSDSSCKSTVGLQSPWVYAMKGPEMALRCPRARASPAS
jgi:hypothetical protein